MARGTIIRRGNSWRICVELPPENGKRRQKWETIKGTKREAEKRLTELLALVDQQKLGANPKMTLAQYLERWLEDYASTLAPKTCSTYQFLVHAYVTPHLGNVQLSKLTPSHIVRLFTLLREAPRQDRRKTEDKLSPATLHAVYRMLKTALNVAVKWQLLPRNPMDGIDAPKVLRKEMKTFTPEQAKAFLDASAQEHIKWQAFFALLLHTGVRPGELKALRWTDVDLDAKAITIQQNAQRIRGIGRVVGQPKTGGSRRRVALTVDVASLLKRHRTAQNEERLQLGPLWQDQNLVFASEVGTILEDKRIGEVFRRICERAGVPRIRLYDLRHSHASLLLALGVHPKVVAERLGHSNVNLTLNLYSHVLPTLQEDAANALDALLKKV